MKKLINSVAVKIFAWVLFAVGSVVLILCGVNLDSVSNVLTLCGGSLSSFGALLISIINSVKDKQPVAKG